MRYLLTEDYEKLSAAEKYVNDNWHKRIPDLSSPKQRFEMVLRAEFVNNSRVVALANGTKVTEMDIITHLVNNANEYVAVINLQVDKTTRIYNGEYIITGDAYNAGKAFIKALQDRSNLAQLEIKGENYMRDYVKNHISSTGSVKNLHERWDYIVYTEQGKLENFKVMKIEDYNIILTEIKENFFIKIK